MDAVSFCEELGMMAADCKRLDEITYQWREFERDFKTLMVHFKFTETESYLKLKALIEEEQ